MTTIADLSKTLASSLDIELEVVTDHARHLFAGETPEKEVAEIQARPEHAAALLISLMSGLPPAHASGALLLYGAMPLDRAYRGVTQSDGGVIFHKLPGDDPFVETFAGWGEIYVEVLSGLIAWFNEAPETNFEVINFDMGGGPGTANAVIHFAALIEGETVIGRVMYNFGTAALAHDGPRARMETQAVIPGAILLILREFFTGTPGGPREVLMSRADLALLSEEGHS